MGFLNNGFIEWLSCSPVDFSVSSTNARELISLALKVSVIADASVLSMGNIQHLHVQLFKQNKYSRWKKQNSIKAVSSLCYFLYNYFIMLCLPTCFVWLLSD
jgi:hypothetical protein